MTQLEIQQAVESIWSLFRETDRRLDQRIKETDQRLDQRMEETRQEITALSAQMRATDQRLDQRIKETDQRLDQRMEETRQEIAVLSTQMRATDQRLDQRFKETDQRFRETDQRLDRHFEETRREIAALSAQTRAAQELFTGQWGRLLEALVRPGVVELFQARGIAVNRSLERPRMRQGGAEMEIDLLLANGDALVVVEVKSTLRVDDVRTLLKDLERFPNLFPEYRDYRRFGAVAALAINESADRYAYRQGLFVLTLGREGLVTLRNDDAFRPKDFTADDGVERITP